MVGFIRRYVIFAPVLIAVSLSAQGSNGMSEETTAPLYGNLGPHSRVVSTTSDTAQAYFNEGMQFMYAFGAGSATKSFRAAQVYDSNCAMCFFGEAWSLSPYLNGRMSLDAERQAHTAIGKARDLLRHATDVERALVEAMAIRFEAEPTADHRRHLDSLYSEAIEDVVRRFPNDLDVATLHGESLMLLRPRRGSVDLTDPSVQKITDILEGVLDRDIRHPGACHLYIHLVEASQDPGKAEACADYLGDAIPGASHIRHMPSHIYMNIGRYSDAVRSNQNAWHTDQQAEYGGPPGIYPSHNLHMLLFGATLDGQSAVAIQAAKDLAVVRPAWSFYHPVVLRISGGDVVVRAWHGVLAHRRYNRGAYKSLADGVHHRQPPRFIAVSIPSAEHIAPYPRWHPQSGDPCCGGQVRRGHRSVGGRGRNGGWTSV